ncbi:hypothetical protein SMICM304S_07938 [Streptomyces microflavus]
MGRRGDRGRVGGLVVELLGEGFRLLLDRREPRGEFGQQTGRLLLVLAAPGPSPSNWSRRSAACSRSLQFFMYSSTKTETFARSTHGSKGLEM